MNTVAVAVNTGGSGRGNGSKRAVRWAVENLLPQADRFVLVHVVPSISHIPTPSGDLISVKDLDDNVVSKYTEDVRGKAQEIFVQYKKLCRGIEVDTVVLEHDNAADAMLECISKSGVRSLVLGSESTNRFWRKIKGPEMPSVMLKSAPKTCDIFVVSKRRVKTKLASSLIRIASSLNPTNGEATSNGKETPWVASSSPIIQKVSGNSSVTGVSQSNSSLGTYEGSHVDDAFNVRTHLNSMASTFTDQVSHGQMSTAETTVSYDQFDLQNEVEQLRLELQTTLALYNRACEDLVNAQKQVSTLSSECRQDAEKINAATEREETLRRIAAEEKAKHVKAIKEVELAKNLLAKEARGRQKAELNARQESDKRDRIVDALVSSERGCRRYNVEEIKAATNSFSEEKVIGEGGYGKVYKGILDHTPVAIKVLQQDGTDKKDAFSKEVSILSQLRHPNIVLLFGACPEIGCLVYEYMENGSLEEHIFRVNGRPPLPWFARFRIAFEIACGIAYLHSKKPEPIVHRDLKPGNILLGRNYESKISDVGLAKLLSDAVPDAVTLFGNSLLAGTLYYIDPEYQRTGTVRPKSDLYSFGIILLQLLTARHPNGLLLVMENTVVSGSLSYILDDTIKDWPLAEAEDLARLALDCCKLRCRDRPDLETEVLPVLKRLADVADASMKVERNSIFAPSHYFCPILHEIMDDPYVAADGFTYEHRAIEAWLERRDVSPVTKNKLQHFNLTLNKTLRSAIQEWRSRVASSSN